MSDQNKPSEWKPITDGYQPRPLTPNDGEQHGYKPEGSTPQTTPPQGGTGSSKPK